MILLAWRGAFVLASVSSVIKSRREYDVLYVENLMQIFRNDNGSGDTATVFSYLIKIRNLSNK